MIVRIVESDSNSFKLSGGYCSKLFCLLRSFQLATCSRGFSTIVRLCYFVFVLSPFFYKMIFRCLGLFQIVSGLCDFVSSGLRCSC